MNVRRLAPAAAVAAAALLLAGCIACPPVPELAALPAKDFATPERAFEYLREALLRGAEDEAYARHEFLCFSSRLKRERGITQSDYFLVRDDVLEWLRERIGDPATVRVERATRLAPDRAELVLASRDLAARVILVRENAYEVRFRDRRTEPVFGTAERPSEVLAIDAASGRLTAELAVAAALEERPDLKVEDVYEVRYVSEWKFYAVDDTEIGEDLRRRLDARRKAAESAPVEPRRAGGP